ncbi:MAG TPA: diacylglycerol kinase family protein [Verrucomicrobiae bacterium]|jgi:diacylglycerol kinase (ATP)|nr:diacylglycerol kinase family protein [Verrucomicrobiae bacterium]
MNVAGLLHPEVSPQAVERFRSVTSTITIRENLDDFERSDAALVFGGDGTVHHYLPQIYEHKIPALIVPKGSGNDFAKALGIFNEKTALQAWQQFCATGSNVREIDVGVIHKDGTNTLFCCIAGAGMDSDANARANRMPVWLRGSAGYLLAALQSAACFKPAGFHVAGDNFDVRRSALFVAAGNAHRYGKGIRIAPGAVLDDGLLDICLVARMNRLKLLSVLPTVFFGAHVRFKEVEIFRTRTLLLETDRPLDLYADGEYICLTPVEISLLPKALKVIVPA